MEPVTLNVDTSQPIRGPAARKTLVETIRDAPASAQETTWLEWKSRATLNEKAWQGEIATHVIGFANREPGRARQAVGGHAYLVLGAEPQNLVGVRLYDPADLESWIARYTGRSEGPRWEPHYTTVDGKSVLVIEVDAPQPGDPIFSLRKTFTDPRGETIPDGTVFIRRLGRTDRPNAADYDMLNRRAAHARSGLDLMLTWWDQPAVIRPVDLSETAQTTWLRRERERLLAPLERDPFSANTRLAQTMRLGLGETRDEEEYRKEVDQYLADAAPALAAEVRARAVGRNVGKVELAIANNTEDNFEQVAVELYIAGELAAFFDADDARESSTFPHRPIPFGTRRSLAPTFDLSPRVPPKIRPPAGYIDNAASAHISWVPLHVRPAYKHALPMLHLIVSGEHAGETLGAAWHATSTSVSGTDSGELTIEISAEPIALDEVMKLG